ncbi:MAG: hypothetical protein E5X84_37670 [Mesorhizobium sp.]|nr:MAG: hypothetical protein E5X84_37670 [Mesorhizobium sp.]
MERNKIQKVETPRKPKVETFVLVVRHSDFDRSGPIGSSRQRADLSGSSQLLGLAEAPRHFVIPGRSKERSDAAQTLGSMPLPWSAAAVQNL